MKQNSFQKNGFLNIGNKTPQRNDNAFDNNIQSIRDRMWQAKSSSFSNQTGSELKITNNINKLVDHQQRVADLRNFNRWK